MSARHASLVANALRRTAPRVWHAWKRVAHKIGDLQARGLLTLFYFLLVAPFALAIRLAADPLAIKPGTKRGWQSRAVGSNDPIKHAPRQY